MAAACSQPPCRTPHGSTASGSQAGLRSVNGRSWAPPPAPEHLSYQEPGVQMHCRGEGGKGEPLLTQSLSSCALRSSKVRNYRLAGVAISPEHEHSRNTLRTTSHLY